MVLVIIFISLFGGCHFGPPVLKDSVLGYDETAADLELELLLLNFARRNAGMPIHFTVASNIAATFDWNTNAGAGADITDGDQGFWQNVYSFNLGFSASENPTFSIYPVAGEEFTQRLLTPLTEDLFNTVIFQDQRIDETVRLLAGGIELFKSNGSYERFIANDPRRVQEYEEFRRIALHLRWLQTNRQLFVRRLIFQQVLLEDFPDQPDPMDITDALSEGLVWKEQEDGKYMLTRTTSGRVVLANYDPDSLSDYERYQMNELIKNKPDSFVAIDISPEGPGGDFPIFGAIKLRSMLKIIDFVAAGIQKYPEFQVPKDPRTGHVDLNPAATLQINATTEKPPAPVKSIQYAGKYYSVADTEWDRSNFRVVYWLFQASVGDIQSPGIPITISK